jgi:hypothetical protein
MRISKQFAVVLLVVGLVFVPVQAIAQPGQGSKALSPQGSKAQPSYITNPDQPTPPPGGNVPSQAVITQTQNVLATNLQAINLGTETPTDLTNSATALQVMFANWEETGANAQIQAQMNASVSYFQTYTAPTTTQASTVAAGMNAVSANVVTESQVYNQLASVTPAQI